MSILFLDPLVLSAYAFVGVLVWLVWAGRTRSWFGRDAGWTVVVWPLPLVTAAVPVLAGLVSGSLARLGIGGDGGGALVGAIYLGAFVVPWTWLTFAPPRRLFPRWARERVVDPPDRAEAPVDDAVPAAHAWRGRGHGSRGRWTYRIDALPGFVWVDGGVLRFRASPDAVAPGSSAIADLDDAEVAQLQLSTGPELRLEPPRGGWWTRRSLDVHLVDLDGWDIDATRPWARDGLLTLTVDGRAPLRVWVADVDAVRVALGGALAPAPDLTADG